MLIVRAYTGRNKNSLDNSRTERPANEAKMQDRSLLGGIWTGACRSDNGADAQAFKALMTALVPVQTTIFEMDGWSSTPSAMPDDMEPMPGIALGDILAEELDADISFGSLVILRNPEAFSDMSRAAGSLVGNILLSVIGRGMFPLVDEDNVLYALGMAYYQAAQAETLTRLGLDPAAFRAGLNTVLAEYWGQPCLDGCLFFPPATAQILPMKQQGRRGAATPSLSALTSFDVRPTLNQWTLRLKSLVSDRTPVEIASRRNVGIS
jgi:hypothetical protein